MGDFALTFKLIVYLNSYKDEFVNEVKLREEVYKKLKKHKVWGKEDKDKKKKKKKRKSENAEESEADAKKQKVEAS